jgi:phospholipid/cholesterol/gamma-HCH transport system substrate-binding protein
MNERAMQIRVGLMVLITLFATAILVAMFGDFSKLFYGTYQVQVSFDQAAGVSDGTPIRKNGVRIGAVKNVALDDQTGKVIVTASIQDRWKLFSSEICRSQTNLMGDAYIEFMRGPGKIGEQLKSGANIRGQSAADPLQMVQNVQGQFTTTIDSVRDTSDSFRGTSDNLQVTLKNLNEMIEENRRGVKMAIDQANSILADTREIIGNDDAKNNLREAIAQLPQMIKDTHETVKGMQQTVKMVDRNLKNIEGFTEPLGQRGSALVNNLERGTRNLDALVSDMTVFTEKLNSADGTIGLLINDPQLYQHLNRAAKNIDEITRELKPIKDDLRVFTDKIARHPESLGVRGVLDKKAGIK